MFKIYICRCESCLACSLPSQHTKFHPKALGIFHSCSFLSNMSDNCRLLVMKNIFEIIDAHKCRHEKQQKPTSQPAQCATFTHAAALGCAPMNIISLQHTREGHSTGRNLCVCAVCCVHMVTLALVLIWRGDTQAGLLAQDRHRPFHIALAHGMSPVYWNVKRQKLFNDC